MFIVIAILIFGILIFVHELGHFLAARACGVRVIEFSIGMGPALFKRQGEETAQGAGTLYSLRAFPFGGFCAMEGEDEASDSSCSLASKTAWQKIFILLSGAAMNFVVGFLMIAVIFSGAEAYQTPEVTGFFEGCPYEGTEMFQEGDVFHRINGHRIYFTDNVRTYLAGNGSDYHDIVILRDGEKILFEDFYMPLVQYEAADGGVELRYGFYFGGVQEAGFLVNLQYSWYQSLDFVRMVWQGLGALLTGAVGLNEMSGPVGVVDAVNQIASDAETTSDGLSRMVYLFALIAINLAVMNLLPIPALDGGRVFFILITWVIEKVSRRKLDAKYESYIHSAGFALLMGLMVVVMFSDVIKIIFR